MNWKKELKILVNKRYPLNMETFMGLAGILGITSILSIFLNIPLFQLILIFWKNLTPELIN